MTILSAVKPAGQEMASQILDQMWSWARSWKSWGSNVGNNDHQNDINFSHISTLLNLHSVCSSYLRQKFWLLESTSSVCRLQAVLNKSLTPASLVEVNDRLK